MLKFTVTPYSHDEGYCSGADLEPMERNKSFYYVVPTPELLETCKNDLSNVTPEKQYVTCDVTDGSGYCGTYLDTKVEIVDSPLLFDCRDYRKFQTEISGIKYDAYEPKRKSQKRYG